MLTINEDKRVLTLKELAAELHKGFAEVRRAFQTTEPAVISREAVALVEKTLLEDRTKGWFLVDGYSVTMTTFQTAPVRVHVKACGVANGRAFKQRFVVEGTDGMLKEDPTGAPRVVDDEP